MKFLANIESRNYDINGNMIFSVKVSNRKAIDDIRGLNAEVTYICEMKSASKRTLNQNAYLWELIGAISRELGQKDEETYLTLLKQAGAKFEYIGAIPEAIGALKDVFRVVELVEERERMNVYRCYYGSSKMNKQEFSELLEITIKWAYELNIDVEAYK